MITSSVNKEIEQDRVFDTVDHFNRWGDPLDLKSRRIYEQLALKIVNKTVLEAGCGNGIGTAILEREMDLSQSTILGTDKSSKNVTFAELLYPWINFCTWNINLPIDECMIRGSLEYQVVVAVEVFEHVENPQAAMDNLLAAATEEVWISTPNGNGKSRPPENPYHVCEYRPEEILYFAKAAYQTDIYHWDTFEQIYQTTTDVHPLVYRIRKNER